MLELRVPPVVVTVVVGALMGAVAWLSPALALALPAKGAAALVLAAAGAATALAGLGAFRRAATTVNPSQPDAASALVVAGIYRWTRNPMYLGFLLMLAGWAVWLAHPLPFLLLPLFVGYMSRFQIEPEERALRQRFGAPFEAYSRATRRWL